MNENTVIKRKSSIIFYLRDFAFEITSNLLYEKHNKFVNNIYKNTLLNKCQDISPKITSYKHKIMKEFGITFDIDLAKNTNDLLLIYLKK